MPSRAQSADTDTPAERIHTLFERALGQLHDVGHIDPALREVFLVVRFRHEFRVGGLSGLLYNSTPLLLRRTIETLELIRAPRTADLLHRAARAWCRGNDLPDTQPAYADHWPLDPATRDTLHALATEYASTHEDLDQLLDAHLAIGSRR